MSAKTIADLLDEEEVLYVPGVWDGMSARVAMQAGYTSLFSSGMAVAASLGMPDADVYTMSENLGALRRIVEAACLPVIADIDTGYGGPLNVMRTVRLFEAAGASAFLIEDQRSPKRCPVCVDNAVDLAPRIEAVARIRAACDAREDSTTLVIARTDASGAEALDRAQAYAEAGADFIFPVSRTFSSLEEWAACREKTGLPLLACLTPSTWVERDFDRSTMKQLGVRIALLPFSGLYAAIGAMRTALRRLRDGEEPAAVGQAYLTHDEFRAFIGFDDMLEIEQRYT